MLAFEGVGRTFGATRALHDVTFRLERGALACVVGSNGAGKTTLLRLAATLDSPTQGRIRVAGLDPREEGARARRSLGWLGQEPGLYDELTVRENLAFVARFWGREGEVPEVATRLGLAARLDARARTLSRGERQRAALARALLMGEVLLLDEPTTALDAEGAKTVRGALGDLRGSRTLLVSTHDDALVAEADVVLRLRAGRLEADA